LTERFGEGGGPGFGIAMLSGCGDQDKEGLELVKALKTGDGGSAELEPNGGRHTRGSIKSEVGAEQFETLVEYGAQCFVSGC